MSLDLPEPWIECWTGDGYPYYWNTETKETRWEPPVNITPTQQEEDDAEGYFEGYLTKKGDLISWKKRYFVLDDGTLYYYDSKESFDKSVAELGFADCKQRSNGSVKIQGVLVGPATSSSTKYDNCFHVQCTPKPMFMYADTKEEFEEWKDKFIENGAKWSARTSRISEVLDDGSVKSNASAPNAQKPSTPAREMPSTRTKNVPKKELPATPPKPASATTKATPPLPSTPPIPTRTPPASAPVPTRVPPAPTPSRVPSSSPTPSRLPPTPAPSSSPPTPSRLPPVPSTPASSSPPTPSRLPPVPPAPSSTPSKLPPVPPPPSSTPSKLPPVPPAPASAPSKLPPVPPTPSSSSPTSSRLPPAPATPSAPVPTRVAPDTAKPSAPVSKGGGWAVPSSSSSSSGTSVSIGFGTPSASSNVGFGGSSSGNAGWASSSGAVWNTNVPKDPEEEKKKKELEKKKAEDRKKKQKEEREKEEEYVRNKQSAKEVQAARLRKRQQSYMANTIDPVTCFCTINVTDYEIKYKPNSRPDFVAYKIEVSYDVVSWVVYRRWKQFVSLDLSFRKGVQGYKPCLPALDKKQMGGKFDKRFLDARKSGLEDYCQILVLSRGAIFSQKTPAVAFKQFIAPVQWGDEKLPDFVLPFKIDIM